jgi:polyferredoxin
MEAGMVMIRKTAWALFVLTIALWLGYAWFTQPYSPEFLGYSLVEQRLITLITLTAMLAAWAYAIALVGEIGSKVVGRIFDEEVKD